MTAAAWRGDLHFVEVFLEAGASVREKTIGYSSPLTAAVRSGNRDVVARLLAAGAKPDGWAAGEAAGRGRQDLLEMFFDAGLDPASRDAQNALISAAISGRASVLRYLLARGVEFNPLDRNFAAQTAASNDHTAVAAFIEGTRTSLEDVPDTNVEFVIERRESRVDPDWSEERIEAAARAILESGEIDGATASVNAHGISLLAAAIYASAASVADGLLDRGANPLWSGCRTPTIVMAAQQGLPTIVHRLIPFARQEDRDEALIEAARFGLPLVVDMLLEAGADPTFTKDGISAVSQASGPYREEILARLRRWLGEHGVAPRPALGVVGRSPRKDLTGLRGVREFVKDLADTNPDWTVVALRKPIRDVSEALAAFYGAPRVAIDVAKCGVAFTSAGVFVIQLKGLPWTIELRSLGFRHSGRFEVDEKICAAISSALACETIYFGGSDTSSTFGAVLYREGLLVDRVEWWLDGKLITGDATRFAGLQGADAWFAALDFFLPACRVDAFGVSPRLDLLRVAKSCVERLDYLVLEE